MYLDIRHQNVLCPNDASVLSTNIHFTLKERTKNRMLPIQYFTCAPGSGKSFGSRIPSCLKDADRWPMCEVNVDYLEITRAALKLLIIPQRITHRIPSFSRQSGFTALWVVCMARCEDFFCRFKHLHI